MNNNPNWILNNNGVKSPFTSFPYAFRAMWNVVQNAIKAKKPVDGLTKAMSIQGPPNAKNERTTYSWFTANQMAKDQGLLQLDGTLNGREFKR